MLAYFIQNYINLHQINKSINFGYDFNKVLKPSFASPQQNVIMKAVDQMHEKIR